MTTAKDASTAQFTICDFVTQAINIKLELKKWILSKDIHSKDSTNVDKQTMHLYSEISRLTDTINQRWDELVSNIEPLHVASSKDIKLLKELPIIVEDAVPGISDLLHGDEVGRCQLRNLSSFDVEYAIGKSPERIGSGRFGDVYRGKLYGQDIAVKVLSHKSLNGDQGKL